MWEIMPADLETALVTRPICSIVHPAFRINSFSHASHREVVTFSKRYCDSLKEEYIIINENLKLLSEPINYKFLSLPSYRINE